MQTMIFGREIAPRILLIPYAILISLAVSLLVAILTIEHFGNDTLGASLLFWSLMICGGTLIHTSVWIVTDKLWGWNWGDNGVKTNWRQTTLGAVLTYFWVLAFNLESHPTMQEKYTLFGQVMVICIIMRVFMTYFGFYRYLDKTHELPATIKDEPEETERIAESPEGAPSPIESSVQENDAQTTLIPEERYLIINRKGVQTRVPVNNISLIEVQDHYCMVYYWCNETWNSWSFHEQLKNLEEQFQHQLIRINRSTLVNPDMVLKFSSQKGAYLLKIKGIEDREFRISRSRSNIVKQLIPVTI